MKLRKKIGRGEEVLGRCHGLCPSWFISSSCCRNVLAQETGKRSVYCVSAVSTCEMLGRRAGSNDNSRRTKAASSVVARQTAASPPAAAAGMVISGRSSVM